MKILQKSIATILIIAVVLSLNFNLFLFKPKQAKALDGGGSWAMAIKEIVLDAIGWTVTDMVLKPLERKIIAWGQGRNTASMESLRVLDYVDYFEKAVALGAAKYIIEFRRTKIEPGIKNVLEDIGLSTMPEYLPPYSEYARSTLEDDLGDNYQNFVDSGYSLQAGGWAGWFSMLKPQNNVFGQIMMAEQERRRQELAEKEAADKRISVSGGYENETSTIETDIQACMAQCANLAIADPGFDGQKCVEKCESQTTGIATKTKVKNIGSDIHKQVDNALSADMQRIISADEISELLGVIFSALINKTINTGMESFRNMTSDTQRSRTETQSTYSYYKQFKKDQTLEDRKDVRSKILSGILNAVQQLSRSITSCEAKEMMKYTDYAKNISDVSSSYVEALYVGLEGVNLKPDFTILDPRFAPFTVYGYSWSNVPANKFPSKCKQITDELTRVGDLTVVITDPKTQPNLGIDATCRSIKSGLEPNYDSRCEECLYNHDTLNCPPAPYPPQPYPSVGNTPWTEKIMEQKGNFYWSCKAPYNTTLNRCDSCIKNADEKCDQANEDDRNNCIENVCNNFEGIENIVVSPPVSGLDFHNKCLIEEKKQACYTCLREYFVPATYCDQINDYTARSIIKYPAVVHFVKPGLSIDAYPWIGPYDREYGNEMGGKCDENSSPEAIDLSLICRIMPDFTLAGEKVCEKYCSIDQEKLRDITDFRPNAIDCNNKKIGNGGNEPYGTINDGLFYAREKCCASAWQHNEAKYRICIGSGEIIEEEEECCYYASAGYEVVEPTNDLSQGQTQICFKIGNVNNFKDDDNKSIVLGVAGDDNAHFIQIRHRIKNGAHMLQPKTGFCFGCDSISENCGWCADETSKMLLATNDDIYKVNWTKEGYSVIFSDQTTGGSINLNLDKYLDIYTNGLDLEKYCVGGSGCSWPAHNTYPDAKSNTNIEIVSCSGN